MIINIVFKQIEIKRFILKIVDDRAKSKIFEILLGFIWIKGLK